MRCVLCDPTRVDGSSSASSCRTRLRKGIVIHNGAHGSTSLKRHVDHIHLEAYEKYEKEISKKRMVWGSERKETKKRKSIQSTEVTRCFGSKDPYKK